MVQRLYSISVQRKVRSVFPPEVQDMVLVALIVMTMIVVEAVSISKIGSVVVQEACMDVADVFVDVRVRKLIGHGVPSKRYGSHQSAREAEKSNKERTLLWVMVFKGKKALPLLSLLHLQYFEWFCRRCWDGFHWVYHYGIASCANVNGQLPNELRQFDHRSARHPVWD